MAKIFGKTRKWTKPNITYYFKNEASGEELSQPEAVEEFQKACDQWAGPTGLTFTQSNSDKADIIISWGDIDGLDGALASSQTPDGANSQRKIKFDTSEEWTNNNVLLTAKNFLAVALHELGHAIGLDHSANPDAVMYPINTDVFVAKTSLSVDDTDGAEYLYRGLDKGIMISNEMDKYISWYAFNSYDTFKWVALNSGDLAPGEFKFYEPVRNDTGQYFIRFTQRGGGTELAGGIVLKDSMISVFSVGSNGVKIQIT